MVVCVRYVRHLRPRGRGAEVRRPPSIYAAEVCAESPCPGEAACFQHIHAGASSLAGNDALITILSVLKGRRIGTIM